MQYKTSKHVDSIKYSTKLVKHVETAKKCNTKLAKHVETVKSTIQN